MITHIVLLQPKPEISTEEINKAPEMVKTLKGSIPGIIDVQISKNRSGNHQGYTYGFLMHFVDSDALDADAPHPAHRVVSEELVRMCSHIIDFDIEQQETR
jgi:hypothetical protein